MRDLRGTPIGARPGQRDARRRDDRRLRSAVRFYRDALGLPERASYASPDGRVAILEAGQATLEIADRRRPSSSTGSRSGGESRVTSAIAFQVADTAPRQPTCGRRARSCWRSPPRAVADRECPARGAGGLQLTLFSEAPRRRMTARTPSRPRYASAMTAEPPAHQGRHPAPRGRARRALAGAARHDPRDRGPRVRLGLGRRAPALPWEDRPARGPWEAWTLLAAIAASTSRIELGPLVACTNFHNPALLAKQAATIDELSGGRLRARPGSGLERAGVPCLRLSLRPPDRPLRGGLHDHPDPPARGRRSTSTVAGTRRATASCCRAGHAPRVRR